MELKKKNVIEEKSKAFALRGIELKKYLVKEKKEYNMSDQVSRSSCSIGSNVAEALQAQSKADFYSKLGISLKEANETSYWLYLLWQSDYISEDYYNSLNADCQELLRLLIAITKHKNDRKESK